MSTTPDDDATASDEDVTAKHHAGKSALNSLLRPVQARLFLGRFLGFVSGILAIAPYIALVRLGDVLLGAELSGTTADPGQVRTITTLLISSFLAQLATLAAGLIVTHFADLKLSAILRDRIIDRIGSAPLSWFTQTTSGKVRKAIQDDTKTLHTLIAHAPVETTAAVVTPLTLMIYAFVIDWRLGLLSIATLPIYFLMMVWMYSDMGDKTAEMDTKLGNVSSAAVELTDGITVVKAFGTVGRAHQRYENAAQEFSDFYTAWTAPLMRGSSLSQAVVSVPVLLLVNLLGGSLLINAGYVSVADVLATSLIALVIPLTIDKISNMQYAYQMAGGSALRLQAILNTEELETPPADHARQPSDDGARVVINDLSFSYSADSPVLENINLRLEPDTVTALIGPSGSGKSTLASLVARFHDPSSGDIIINDVDLRDMTTSQLYSTVSFVLQDPQLLRISLRDNIRLARPDATDEQVYEAARAAHILDELLALPRGLDSIYGEDAELSGGQDQRVSIARALLADTPVLILDEATAASDPDSEAEVQQALNHLVVGRTVLVIAHRPESVFGVDQLVRLDQGHITTVLTGADITPDTVRAIMTEQPHQPEGKDLHV